MRLWNPFGTAPGPDLQPLTARVDQLETAVRLLRLEWHETLDKVEHALARNAKRLRDAQKADQEPERGNSAPLDRAARKAAIRASMGR